MTSAVAIGATTPHFPSFDRLAAGADLPDGDALALVDLGDVALNELCAAAGESRDRGRGNVITFSPKVFIPLTRVCRDFCGYCTFRQSPGEADDLYLTADQVLAVASAGQRLGCTEALFTLGERPEQRYSEAGDWLTQSGYRTTLEYLSAMCRMVFEKTDLLPHGNPGTMSRRELEALQPTNPSVGIMLESSSPRLYEAGGPHEFAPSKRPRVRLRTMELAGELGIPFTTGILIGIGETRTERVESLLAIRDLHRRFGHIQEVIVQNFRAKSDTPMADTPDAAPDELMWTTAVARLIMGETVNIQVPPNLSENYERYIAAGINDWGGVSPLTIDYVNPEAPWPQLKELERRTREAGYELRPRLPVYPEYFANGSPWPLPEPLKEKLLRLTDQNGYVKGGTQRYARND
ncbi:MAG: 7,8-didemethyl-8-hydroxy-5-deazariboflavin synthase CofG [Dehalococcoidia bacterium]|nr:7,8-didemethyl-8-hydroxy-5-deazariboflavin synthase CofG [Dehalococcoidia bacterium]